MTVLLGPRTLFDMLLSLYRGPERTFRNNHCVLPELEAKETHISMIICEFGFMTMPQLNLAIRKGLPFGVASLPWDRRYV